MKRGVAPLFATAIAIAVANHWFVASVAITDVGMTVSGQVTDKEGRPHSHGRGRHIPSRWCASR